MNERNRILCVSMYKMKVPDWMFSWLTLLVAVIYVMLYTGAFDIYTQENLKLLGISILMVVFSYSVAYLIVSKFSKPESQYMVITITKPIKEKSLFIKH